MTEPASLVEYIAENPGCTARYDIKKLRDAGIVIPSGTRTARGGEGLMVAARAEVA
jgi:hypothetical protein